MGEKDIKMAVHKRGHTNRHTDGHRDSMTESAQWADSVKTEPSVAEP